MGYTQQAGIHPAATNRTLSPEEFAKGKDTVAMVFERSCLFTIVGQIRVRFPAGVPVPVPAALQGHWFLKAHGAKPFKLAAAETGSQARSRSSKQGLVSR